MIIPTMTDACQVHHDLTRYMADQDASGALDDAIETVAQQIQSEWTMALRCDPDGSHYWAIMHGRSVIADEWCASMKEAWQGMQDAWDRLAHKAAEKQLKDNV